jgi:segregation and condensation protein B
MEHETRVDDADASVEEEANATDLEKNLNLENIVLAILFAADEPVTIRKLGSVIEDAPADDIREALDRWRVRMDEEAWSVRIEQVAGGYQISTRPDYAIYVSRLYQGKRKFRLSRAALETLAIIAYKQPVTRAEVENVRGVACGGVIANLMERSLIKITGKARVLGAPFLYGTTQEFLEYLGLNSLGDLPSLDELENLLEKEAYPEDAVEPAHNGDQRDSDAEAGEDDEDGDVNFTDAVAALEAAARSAADAAGKKKAGAEAEPDDGSGPSKKGVPRGAASILPGGEDMLTPPGEVNDEEVEDAIPTVQFEREAPDAPGTQEPDDNETSEDDEKR